MPGSDRVIHLPPNSSWQDALRTEKAVQRVASFDAIDHPEEVEQGAFKWKDPLGHHVYEPNWREEEDAYPGDAFLSSEAQRMIFCSRAFAFDVSPSARARGSGGPARQSQSRELQIPAAMPARFRHAASGMPQLTDGKVGGNGSDLPDPLASQPIVSLLLPSAALRGVVPEGVAGFPGAHMDGAANMDSKEQAVDTELMQVQCKVLNASRFGS